MPFTFGLKWLGEDSSCFPTSTIGLQANMRQSGIAGTLIQTTLEYAKKSCQDT